MSKTKLKIENLFKIFGPKGKSFIDPVKNGMSKQELLDNHSHVLGLNNINLDIPEQRIQVIMGLSGSGKSTLIRHINRLIEPTAGAITVDDEDILSMSQIQLREFRRKKTSMVFQKFALLPHKTVAQNVAYGLTIQGEHESVAKEKSHKWIESVGLSGFEERYPAQLSGGMQQRVGLARALATDAPILLMDEAFSALDPLIRTDMQNILLELQKDSMVKFLMKIPKLYYTKSHFPLEISQRAFDHLWRVCESYEMWCRETKQENLIYLNIIE